MNDSSAKKMIEMPSKTTKLVMRLTLVSVGFLVLIIFKEKGVVALPLIVLSMLTMPVTRVKTNKYVEYTIAVAGFIFFYFVFLLGGKTIFQILLHKVTLCLFWAGCVAAVLRNFSKNEQ